MKYQYSIYFVTIPMHTANVVENLQMYSSTPKKTERNTDSGLEIAQQPQDFCGWCVRNERLGVCIDCNHHTVRYCVLCTLLVPLGFGLKLDYSSDINTWMVLAIAEQAVHAIIAGAST